MSNSRGILTAFILALVSGATVTAQTTPTSVFDFGLFVTVNGTSGTVANDGTIPIIGQLGTQTSATVVATYTGATQAIITAKPQIIGSSELAVSVPGNVTFPLTLTPGQKFTFEVSYTPVNANVANAQLQVPYTETTSATTTPAPFLLIFQGVAPSFTLSYILPPNDNVTAIASGQTITFPATKINTSTTAQLNITDTGSGPGTITNITISASSVFQLSGTPLFPYTEVPGSSATDNLSIGIVYTPTAVSNDTAQITISYLNNATSVINLAGTGATSTFSYSYIAGTGASTPVSPGGTITLPGVPVAAAGTTQTSSTAIVQIMNKGNANGTINSISVSAPFALVNPPSTFPISLTPGGTTSFTISYTPTQVGTQTGSLVVGSDVFIVSSQGIGPQLTFSYGGVPVGTGAVVFPAIAVSQSEQVQVTVTNSGTSSATIALVSVSPNPPFSVSLIPPTSLAAGKSITFPITFMPVDEGPVNGNLLVNSTSVPLVGAGTTPPALPSYTFSGPSGQVSPVTQAPVTLTLSKSYPVDLNGVLTLTTSGSLGTDPNVQFVSGGRTVDFTIPANTTSADFAGQGSQILLQTGTVAETVTLSPTFATTGGVNLTPASPATLQFTVPTSAPVLTSAQPTDETASSFTLLIIGYTTTRELDSITVTFTPAAGYNFSTSQFSADLSQVSALWFQGSSSLSFGGVFQISIPFNLTGSVPASKTLLGTIASVSATISNSVGTSNSIQASLP